MEAVILIYLVIKRQGDAEKGEREKDVFHLLVYFHTCTVTAGADSRELGTAVGHPIRARPTRAIVVKL